MKIALLGFGKMGQEIAKIAEIRGHTIVLKASAEHPFVAKDLADADVAIEFSEPKSAVDNIFKAFKSNVPVVVGTTGWYNRFPEVRDECLNNGNTLFYATNFSLGVNLFFELNKYLAKMMRNIEGYNPTMEEVHHTEKKDSPSGTAITLAETIIDQLEGKKNWVNYPQEEETELSIVSMREPQVPGTHTIEYESAFDFINITHEAKNRLGFALGAVKSAEWVAKKQGVFTMKDMLNL